MGKKGFIFDNDLCVGCKACSAACMLENKWSFRARKIYSSNPGFIPGLPVINLSLACNHCEHPACLEGCPTGAYKTDTATGAVLLDTFFCIGCKYCTWNCPYDAPQMNSIKGYIEKCHYCYQRQEEGYEPACSSACPTGALSFGKLNEYPEKRPAWFPDKDLIPSVRFTGRADSGVIEVIPATNPEMVKPNAVPGNSFLSRDHISLLVFTSIITFVISGSIVRLFSASITKIRYDLILIAIALISSLMHISSLKKAWFAVRNIKSSPLSREIALLLVFISVYVFSVVFSFPNESIYVASAGLLLLISIDHIYMFPFGKKALRFHSGQTLLICFTIVSFYLEATAALLFIAAVRILLSLPLIFKEGSRVLFALRFIRISLLLIIIFANLSPVGYAGNTLSVLLLTGEIFDRLLFYTDFNPVSIKNNLK